MKIKSGCLCLIIAISFKELLQEIPYHLQRMEFGAEIDGSEDFFQVNINLNSDIQTTCLYS